MGDYYISPSMMGGDIIVPPALKKRHNRPPIIEGEEF
jgi:hypothetical protein